MNNEHPIEGQVVEVKIGGGAWQSATYRRGQFVDLYGLTLDQQKISEWQPVALQASAIGDGAVTAQESSLLH
ncbi:MAG: hypothetical protein ABIW82_01605 [Dokdonella sp.]